MGRIFGVLKFFILVKFIGSSKNLGAYSCINGFIFKGFTCGSMPSYIFYPIRGKKNINSMPLFLYLIIF